DDATSSICGPSSGSQPDAVVHGSGQFANHRRDSPNKKLDKENGTIEDDDEPGGQLQRGGRARSSQKKKKKSEDEMIAF
uniref:Uncharacterized protein n=1 Tax=Parascaris equorum TaxID=6256 RepID=A0A914S148_PAREQ